MRMRPSAQAEGFEETFRELFPQACSVARRILGSDSQAEDAAAEAFARALARWRRVGRLPHRDAWILRVTANVAIDTARRLRRGVVTADPGDLGSTPSPADAAATRLALLAALEQLPRRQREVVTLRYLADLSESTVAECLGVHVGTVQQHAHRGMKALRSRLGSQIREEVPLGTE